MIALHERIIAKIEEIRPLLKEYELLSEDQKKATRHMIYVATGGFGRSFTSIFEAFKNTEAKLDEKKLHEEQDKAR